MKKILYTILFATLSLSVIHSQTVNTKQATLVVKRTADWCTFCGQYGWTFFKDLQTNVAGKPAILMAAHHSGTLFRGFARDVTDNYGGGGQPVFYVNGTDALVGSSNVAARITSTVATVNQNANANATLAVGATLIKKNDNSYTVRASLEAQSALSNVDYYVSAYVLRNKFIAPQQSQGSSASHTNLMDINLTTNTFGNPLVKGNLVVGAKNSVDIPMNAISLHPGATLADVKVAILVWNKVGNNYQFVNGVETDLSKFTSSSTSLTALSNDFKAYQVSNELIVEFEKETKNNTRVDLYNITGQRVASAPLGIGSTKTISLLGTQPGVYMINVNTEGKSVTRKMMIK